MDKLVSTSTHPDLDGPAFENASFILVDFFLKLLFIMAANALYMICFAVF